MTNGSAQAYSPAGSLGDLIRQFPEVHHYTTLQGLKGILGTDTLWATHYQDLNDATEVYHLKPRLIVLLKQRFRTLLRNLQKDSLRIRMAVQKSGGLETCSYELARDLINSLYKVSFEDTHDWALAPYITSFCAHEPSSYEADNGLLSQWRGYSGAGGFAIVFDTGGIVELLRRETDAFYYAFLGMVPAVYATADLDTSVLLDDFLDKAERVASTLVHKEDPQSQLEDLFVPLVTTATRFKHEGFREESEVRIVGVPGTAALKAQIRREFPNSELPPVRAISSLKRNGRVRRHISLFDSLKLKLPIRRVVVGPGRERLKAAEMARDLLGTRCKVVPSETPFTE